MTLSKKELNAKVLEENAKLFRCPICSSSMEMVNYTRLMCQENHSFDLSKNGYVNLAPQVHLTKYAKVLFDARKQIMSSGYFSPVIEEIVEMLNVEENMTILDAGCGEGTHLAEIVAQLPESTTAVGIDLAKDGIVAAAKSHAGVIWSVADLANCPFQDEQYDTILNILSPANYAEFTRLLKPDGLFIKVVPEKGYLKELREMFYDDDRQKEEVDVKARFEEQFVDVETTRITYQFLLKEELLAPLVQMTPLTWGASAEKIEQVLRSRIPEITVDFTILIGRKRGNTGCLVE